MFLYENLYTTNLTYCTASTTLYQSIFWQLAVNAAAFIKEFGKLCSHHSLFSSVSSEFIRSLCMLFALCELSWVYIWLVVTELSEGSKDSWIHVNTFYTYLVVHVYRWSLKEAGMSNHQDIFCVDDWTPGKLYWPEDKLPSVLNTLLVGLWRIAW